MSINQNSVINGDGTLAKEMTVGGITFPANSTPEQRQAIVAKAGLVTQWHTDPTVNRMNQGDANPVPLPDHLTRLQDNRSAYEKTKNELPPSDNVAAFDREMQERGMQIMPDGQRVTAPDVDHEAIALVSERYKTLMRGNPSEEAAARFKAAFEKDLTRLYNGERLTDKQMVALRKSAGNGNIETFVPGPPASPNQNRAPEVSTAVKSMQDEGGWVDIGKLTLADTHGYKISRYTNDQTMHKSMLQMLKAAKAAGVTQEELNAVMHQEAIMHGWVKA